MSSHGKLDPIRALNYDCTSLVFDHLSLSDLTRVERVSKDWKARLYAWMANEGIVKRFPHALPDKHSDAEAGEQDVVKVKRFKKYVIEGTSTERLAAGRALSVNTYTAAAFPSNNLPLLAGDFVVLGNNVSILWDQIGNREEARRDINTNHALQPINLNSLRFHTGPATAPYRDRWTVEGRRLHAAGFLHFELSEPQAETSWVYMLELETGNVLWSQPKSPTSALTIPIAMGWKRIYYYGPQTTDLEAYDLKTGALLYSRRSFFPKALNIWHDQIWRVGGREVFVGISSEGKQDKGTMPVSMYLIDAESGAIIQVITFMQYWTPGLRYDPLLTLKVSTRRNELAFAWVSYNSARTLAMIHTFDYDRVNGEFVERGLEEIDLVALGVIKRHGLRSRIDCDPFRGIIASANIDGGSVWIHPLRLGSMGDDAPTQSTKIILDRNPKEDFSIGKGGTNPHVVLDDFRLDKIIIAGNRLCLKYQLNYGTPGTDTENELAVLDFGSPGSSALDEGAFCLHSPDMTNIGVVKRN
ncbi:uncharacterized protein DSM5745_00087 [Aspergillus mulundensis]|uniref:F-box domain-containing protein n=1 Tax=Aspergillus mulundensis TaxID=1810919 RepID=A0A3D8T2H2_9EURO|nr:hypothetical protein DSM5745_00087 [Aspergillus mulundensis]RDW92765.1 hypothetical protein DSM5745_00087 [Aspergillus mulundensis]